MLYLAMSMCSSVMAMVDFLKSLCMRRCMDAPKPSRSLPSRQYRNRRI
jgi:hypothetical protein